MNFFISVTLRYVRIGLFELLQGCIDPLYEGKEQSFLHNWEP